MSRLDPYKNVVLFQFTSYKSCKAILTWTRISVELSKFFGTDKFFSVLSNKAVQDIAALNDLNWKRTSWKKCPIRPARFEKSLDVWQTKCQWMRNICCVNSKTWDINFVYCFFMNFQLTVWKVWFEKLTVNVELDCWLKGLSHGFIFGPADEIGTVVAAADLDSNLIATNSGSVLLFKWTGFA